MVDAKKEKKGPREALALLEGQSRLVVARGKKVQTFDLRRKPLPQKEILAAIMGPSGNLRAPTLRRGKTVLVGFNEEAYDEAL